MYIKKIKWLFSLHISYVYRVFIECITPITWVGLVFVRYFRNSKNVSKKITDFPGDSIDYLQANGVWVKLELDLIEVWEKSDLKMAEICQLGLAV